MRKIRKAAALTLSLLLAASTFSGCGQGAKKDDSASQGSAGTAQSSAPVPIKFFVNSNPEGSESDKAWVSAIEKGTNTKITLEIPPSANYAERMNIMLAGGDYADAILFLSNTDKSYIDAVNNGILIPLNKYIDNSPNLKKYTYAMSWDTLKTKGDNDIYAIPRTSIQRADGFEIRQDWLDAIGFKVPSDNLITIEQFEEIMTKFTKNDPDKNGKADTYGWCAFQDGKGNLSPILTYPFGDRGWQKTSGEKYEYMTPMYSRETDNYKKALEFTAKLYKSGAIDPNFASIKIDAANARFEQGITGAKDAFAGYIAGDQDKVTKMNPNAKVTYISGVKDASGKFQRGTFGTGFWGNWGISKTCKNPETVVKVLDYMLSDEGWAILKYGVEGVTYKVEGSEKAALPEFSNFAWGNYFVRRNNDPEYFVKLNMREEYKEPVTKWIDTAIKGNVASMDYGYRPAAADKPELIDYGKQLDQVRAKIILGNAPPSDWDKALDGWYKAGGEEYVTQMNDYIKKIVANKK